MSTPSDDRTILAPSTMRGGTGNGTGNSAPATPDQALPVGSLLAEFEITEVLGAGGFGIVYLVYDQLLQRHVALKEYLPAAFALREASGRVCPRSERDAEAFDIGLRSFVNEARLLAQFDAPSLLKVYRFWETNGTAYMVMPYYRGPTLKQVLAAADAPVPEVELRRWLDGILEALALMHDQHCYHRDIAPDNILMVDGERPVLLDFGAARRAIGDMDQFTTIFKQAYAPVEQISEYPDMRQGPWTDLFALAAVAHFAIDGKPPPPAISRLMKDGYVPLSQRHADRYSQAFLSAIDRTLAVKPQDRPQSAQQMRELLGQAAPAPAHAPAPAVQAPVRPEPAAVAPPPDSISATEAPRRRSRMLPVALGVGVAVLAAAGIVAYTRSGAPAALQTAARPASVPQAVQAAAASAVAAAADPASLPATLPADTGSDPAAAMAQVVAGASPDHAVSVTASPPRLVIGRDAFKFTVRSARPGYVYVHLLGTEGGNAQMIFPNDADRDNRIAAGQALTLARPSWKIDAVGPAGTDRFLVIVSDAPRDFDAAALKKGDIFSEILPASTGKLAAAMAGTPACAPGSACPQGYGATTLTIEEVAQ
jgi:serine/threonine protein kinase